jgi:hypothetical protein
MIETKEERKTEAETAQAEIIYKIYEISRGHRPSRRIKKRD